MEKHLSSDHNGKPNRACIYCKKVFITEGDFKSHLHLEHSLPVSKPEIIDQVQVKSAFGNTFKSFHIDGDDSPDFLEFMLEKESIIRETLLKNAQRSPIKVQICVTIRLEKPTREEDEKTEIHLNTEMTPVFAEGLSRQGYFEMIDRLLAILFSFTAHGSGWVLDKKIQVEVKMASLTPARGSSYLALPSELQGM